MLKKYIIFGSVVLLVAALFTLTGCSQATDSDGGTLSYSENHLFGEANADDVALAVASAKQTGRSVVLTDGVRLVGSPGLPSVADFEDLPVRVEGNALVTDGIIVNAAFANLTFMDDSSITVRNNGAFIYQGNDNFIITDNANPGFKVRYVANPLTGTQGTDLHVAVSEYTIGANYGDIAQHITDFYVLKKLTIDGGSTAAPGTGARPVANPRVIALGEVDLAANNSLVFGDLANFRFTTSAVLTSKVQGVTLTLPSTAAVQLPTIEAAVPMTITAGGALPGLRIEEIRGPETLAISNAAGITNLALNKVTATGRVTVSTDVLPTTGITENAGSITFAVSNSTGTDGAITVGDPATPGSGNSGTITIGDATLDSGLTVRTVNSGTINIGSTSVTTAPISIARNTGAVNFTQAVSFGAVDYLLRIPANDGEVNFYNTLATTAALGDGGALPTNFSQNIKGNGAVAFGGLANFTGAVNIDCKVVFTAGVTRTSGDLAFGGDVTLANEQAITLTTTDTLTLKPGKRLLVGDVPVLAAGLNGAGAVITPVTGAVLTAGRAQTADDDDAEFVLDRTLILDTAAISGIAGDLRIAGGGILAGDVAITLGSGTLTLEDGAVLALGGNAGKVNLGAATASSITGAASGTTVGQLTASGGAVTLGADKISGSGSTLLIPEDAGNPVISVPATTALVLAGANLDLVNAGSLTLTAATSAIRLEAGTNPGKITLVGADELADYFSLTSLTGKKLASGGINATLSGSGIIRADGETLPAGVGDLSGDVSGTLGITSGGTNFTLSNTGVTVTQ
jgi:hypothetical protein